MKPLVSICIPVYNVERYIGKCCNSLFGQSYPNIEYIFVDDCTSDGSIQVIENVLKNFPDRKDCIKIVRHEKNKGLSAARNTAIAVSSGKYIMHVDSDDYLDLNVVECVVAKAQEEHADVVLYDIRYVYHDRQFIEHQEIPPDKLTCIQNLLIYKMRVCVWGGLYSSELFKTTGVGFVEGINFGEDYVVKPRIFYYAHKIVHCDGCYYNYVQYNTTSYTNSFSAKNIDDLIKVISILNSFFLLKSDYEVYAKSISIAHLCVKYRLLIAICLHHKQVWNRLPMVAALYEDKRAYYKYVPLFYRLILLLAQYNCCYLLYFYVKCGFGFKQLLKRYF